EELSELRDALRTGLADDAVREELGDILFVLINLARRLNLSPESVLEAACGKFERRFAHVCDALAQRGLRPEQADLDTLEALWLEAKQIEHRSR
ncbi:MAG: MazG nucleotide pyrophosphohydrolase domain-containing protein, partial [Nevskiales bacterium]